MKGALTLHHWKLVIKLLLVYIGSKKKRRKKEKKKNSKWTLMFILSDLVFAILWNHPHVHMWILLISKEIFITHDFIYWNHINSKLKLIFVLLFAAVILWNWMGGKPNVKSSSFLPVSERETNQTEWVRRGMNWTFWNFWMWHWKQHVLSQNAKCCLLAMSCAQVHWEHFICFHASRACCVYPQMKYAACSVVSNTTVPII